jgi:hypothetical protein
MVFDDESGYSFDDPKHPEYFERFADWGDSMKKKLREEGTPFHGDDTDERPKAA